MQTFKAKLDDLSKIITYVILIALLIPVVLFGNMALRGNPEVLIPIGIVLLALGITWLFQVKEYVLTADSLQIIRKIGSKQFPRASFASATPVTNKELGFGIRLFGSGGFAGYLGTFYYRNAGKVQAYATDRNKLILLRTTDGKQVLVSPEDQEGFLKALKLPQAPIEA